MTHVLMLNQDYTPLQVITWRKAMEHLIAGKVELLEDYADRAIRTARESFPFPAVVRLVEHYVQRRVRLSRQNIIARDAYTCQYCGAQPRKSSGSPDLQRLTIDHVVPRAHAQGGWVTLPWSGERVRLTSWKNLLTSCASCNFEKADRTPRQAGMHPRKLPAPPSSNAIAWMFISRQRIPDEWKGYLDESNPWARYWSVELSD